MYSPFLLYQGVHMNQEEFALIGNILRNRLEVEGAGSFDVRIFMENSDVLVTGEVQRVEDHALFIKSEGRSEIFCPASRIVAIRIFNK